MGCCAPGDSSHLAALSPTDCPSPPRPRWALALHLHPTPPAPRPASPRQARRIGSGRGEREGEPPNNRRHSFTFPPPRSACGAGGRGGGVQVKKAGARCDECSGCAPPRRSASLRGEPPRPRLRRTSCFARRSENRSPLGDFAERSRSPTGDAGEARSEAPRGHASAPRNRPLRRRRRSRRGAEASVLSPRFGYESRTQDTSACPSSSPGNALSASRWPSPRRPPSPARSSRPSSPA